MGDRHDGSGQDPDSVRRGRRQVLMAGAGLAAAAPMLASAVSGDLAQARAARAGPAVGTGPFAARAYGAATATSGLAPMQIQRRALQPQDVLIDVLYCGICHSDIHTARDEWNAAMPTAYPSVPGHEIIGRVAAVGSAVTKFKVGDIGGIGCIVNSCLECDHCHADREQNCEKGASFTYNTPDAISGGHTYGGYSDKIVVPQHFVIRIPPGADLAATAPLLCAGVTTFSPMQHWKLSGGQRVGVIGLGGLGHIAVKLAVARKAEVTIFTTTPGKLVDAQRLGAKEAVLWNDAAAMKRLAGRFDLLISTVPQAYPMQPFIELLKLDATLVNVGAMDALRGISGLGLVFGRYSVAGSLIGGIAETQEVIDYCTARGIKADIEMVRPDQINMAYDRVVNKDVRYRFVIDMASLKQA
ncbi:NAD(P)-dependent alcohol dehydrogenase [Burkholderia multivorans]|uniref:NAD(P)-dependent alcohol dehydrogenase n=1 Tax=Burkholderia multivorans TaxID=87883 RepID=UPI0023EEA700|nr:NAD(P)-dependent alcohol dehydrogenase [Burkholderia multivorans]